MRIRELMEIDRAAATLAGRDATNRAAHRYQDRLRTAQKRAQAASASPPGPKRQKAVQAAQQAQRDAGEAYSADLRSAHERVQKAQASADKPS